MPFLSRRFSSVITATSWYYCFSLHFTFHPVWLAIRDVLKLQSLDLNLNPNIPKYLNPWFWFCTLEKVWECMDLQFGLCPSLVVNNIFTTNRGKSSVPFSSIHHTLKVSPSEGFWVEHSHGERAKNPELILVAYWEFYLSFVVI